MFAELLKLDIHGPERVKSGRSLILTCALIEGGNVRFSWFKDGRILSSALRTAISSTAETSILTVSNTATQDSGEYSCLARNGLSEARKSKRIHIEGSRLPCRSYVFLFLFFLTELITEHLQLSTALELASSQTGSVTGNFTEICVKLSSFFFVFLFLYFD